MSLHYAMPFVLLTTFKKSLNVADRIKTGQHSCFVSNQKSRVIEYKCKQNFSNHFIELYLLWNFRWKQNTMLPYQTSCSSIYITFSDTKQIGILSSLIYLLRQKPACFKKYFQLFSSIFFCSSPDQTRRNRGSRHALRF